MSRCHQIYQSLVLLALVAVSLHAAEGVKVDQPQAPGSSSAEFVRKEVSLTEPVAVSAADAVTASADGAVAQPAVVAASDAKTPAVAAETPTASPAEGTTEVDVIPPVPEPTPEQLTKRHENAQPYMSLGEKFFNFPLTGLLSSRYRLRSTSGVHDQDVSEYLSIDAGNKTQQAVTGHVDARFADDLQPRKGLNSDIYSGILDTYNNSQHVRLYSAYADFNKIPGVDVLRAGRQWLLDTPEVFQVDGGRLDTKPFLGDHELQFSFYGGEAVHLDQSSEAGNVLGGVSAEARPWKSTKLRFDFTHIESDLSSQSPVTANLVAQTLQPTALHRHDDLSALSLWQTFKNPDVNLFGRVTVLDDQVRDVQMRTVYYNHDCRLQVAANYQAYLETVNQLVTEIDPFTDSLRGQEAYQNGSLEITKDWNDYFRTEAGATIRRLDGGKVSTFNHEFDRYNLTFDVHDLPLKGFSTGLTGYWWDGKGDAPRTGQIGGYASYDWSKKLRTTVGSDYSSYKYDALQQVEEDQVRTYYIKQRWKPTRWAKLDASYEFEKSIARDFHTFTVTFNFSF